MAPSFYDNLAEGDTIFIKICMSDRMFCFGDGLELKSTKTVKFPVIIADVRITRVYIGAVIVKNHLSLLLSYKFIKTAGMLLDCGGF